MATPISVGIMGYEVKYLLEKMGSDLNRAIQRDITQVGNEVDNVIVVAEQQLALAIENAKTAYLDVMTKTVESVDKAIQDVLLSFESSVEQITKQVFDRIDDIQNQATLFLDQVPFTDKHPTLRKMTQYIVLKDGEPSKISFAGNFFKSADPALKPQLLIDNAEDLLIEDANHTSLCLNFKVTVPLASERNYLKGKLVVPYSETVWIIWSKVTLYEFSNWINIVPQIAGDATVFYRSHAAQRLVTRRSCPPLIANGNTVYDKNHPHPQMWLPQEFFPDNGWKVVPGSVSAPIVDPDPSNDLPHGKWGFGAPKSFDPNKVIVDTWVDATDGHNMGVVKFHVDFDQEQEHEEMVERSQEFTLTWGNSLMTPIPGQNERISHILFKAFDGSSRDIAGSGDISKFLNAKYIGETGAYLLDPSLPTIE